MSGEMEAPQAAPGSKPHKPINNVAASLLATALGYDRPRRGATYGGRAAWLAMVPGSEKLGLSGD